MVDVIDRSACRGDGVSVSEKTSNGIASSEKKAGIQPGYNAYKLHDWTEVFKFCDEITIADGFVIASGLIGADSLAVSDASSKNAVTFQNDSAATTETQIVGVTNIDDDSVGLSVEEIARPSMVNEDAAGIDDMHDVAAVAAYGSVAFPYDNVGTTQKKESFVTATQTDSVGLAEDIYAGILPIRIGTRMRAS